MASACSKPFRICWPTGRGLDFVFGPSSIFGPVIRRDVKMNSMQPISTLPEAEAPRLPCPAPATDAGESRLAVIPGESGAVQPPETPPQQAEPYQDDRALHAMFASLTGGVSPVALSLAYIDWASHLTGAPQRRME